MHARMRSPSRVEVSAADSRAASSGMAGLMDVDETLDRGGAYAACGTLRGGFKRPTSCVKWSPEGSVLGACSADGS